MTRKELPKTGGIFAGCHRDKDGNPLLCVEIGGAVFEVGPINAVEKFLRNYRRYMDATDQ